MIKKEDGALDFNEDAHKLALKVRAYQSWPGTFAYLNGTYIKICKAEEVEATVEMPNTVILVEKDSFTIGCAKNALKVTMIKPQGKREMSVKDYLLGKKINIGDVLTKDEH